MTRRLAAVLFLAAGILFSTAAVHPAQAEPATLTPGLTLQVRFTADPTTFPSDPDVLILHFGNVSGSQDRHAVTVLSNHGTVLGTHSRADGFGAEFRSASSLWSSGTIIDFSSFARTSPPIQGVLEHRLTSGTITIEDTGMIGVAMGRSFEPGGGFFFSGITVQSVEIVATTSGTIRGTVGIVDSSKWPIDGADAVVRAWAVNLATWQYREAEVTKPTYTVAGLPAGDYAVLAFVSYADKIDANIDMCGTFQVGCTGGIIQKTLYAWSTTATRVEPGVDRVVDVNLPPITVMIHGIGVPLFGGGCYTKWFSVTDPNAWDNTARANGVVSFTPNYHYITEGSWALRAIQVLDQVGANLGRLTSGAAAWGWPPWVIIAHSQGGLVARALLGEFGATDQRVQSIRRVYMLGTPNSGASENMAQFACTPELRPSSMMTVFNKTYTTFSPLQQRDVIAFAGTELNGQSDGITFAGLTIWTGVPWWSVFGIWAIDCNQSCTYRFVNAPTYGGSFRQYNHFELGSSDSVSIFNSTILPGIRSLR